jgi:hypothetical protein
MPQTRSHAFILKFASRDGDRGSRKTPARAPSSLLSLILLACRQRLRQNFAERLIPESGPAPAAYQYPKEYLMT